MPLVLHSALNATICMLNGQIIKFGELFMGRICDKCGVMSIVLSYTKKGLMTVMCSKCGKVWRTREKKELR